jgi:hypothetical protein
LSLCSDNPIRGLGFGRGSVIDRRRTGLVHELHLGRDGEDWQHGGTTMASQLHVVPNRPAAQAAPDDKDPMEQVRELLFGEAKRAHDTRLEEIAAALKLIEAQLSQRFEGIDTRIEQIAKSMRTEQNAAFKHIGTALADVGRRIASMGEKRERDREATS